MPNLPPNFGTALRRGAVGFGRALRPAIGPLAVGGAALIGLHGVQLAVDSYGRLQNPPAQTGSIPYGTPTPNDGSGEAGYFFDPRTGRTFFFGDPPTEGSGPERSEERVTKTALIAGAAAIAAVAFIVINTKRK